jgi:hypothetical protein
MKVMKEGNPITGGDIKSTTDSTRSAKQQCSTRTTRGTELTSKAWLALFDPRRSFFPEHRISMMCFLLACIGLQAVFLFGQKISKALWGKYPVLFKIFLFSFYFLGSCPGVL